MSNVFSTSVLIGDTVYSRSNWNLEVLVFMEGGKPENPEKNPRSKDENQQQTQPTYGTGPESNPGHIGGRRALSPLRHPCSPTFVGWLQLKAFWTVLNSLFVCYLLYHNRQFVSSFEKVYCDFYFS